MTNKVNLFFLPRKTKYSSYLEIKSLTTREKKPSTTKFETSLPNEILFEIFKYLTQSELFYAFLNLNQRFNQILQPFTHHIDCSKLSIEQFEHIRNHLCNARSLTINNQVKFSSSIKSFRFYSSSSMLSNKFFVLI